MERLPPGGERDALAVVIRAALREADALEGLPVPGQPRTVNSSMQQTAEHRAALSEAIAPGGKWLKWIRAKEHGGYSQNRLAAAVGMSVSALSAARRPKNDASSRPIPLSKAQQVEALTGWPADEKHWPAGIRKD
jgi:hypothetical protein